MLVKRVRLEIVRFLFNILLAVQIIVSGPFFRVPPHQLGDMVEAILFPLQRGVEIEVAPQNLILRAQVALPVKFVPGEVSAFLPIAIGISFKVKIAHELIPTTRFWENLPLFTRKSIPRKTHKQKG